MRAAVLLAVFACSSSSSPTPSPAPASDGLAADFTLKDVTGTTVHLADAVEQGPVVLVWGSFT